MSQTSLNPSDQTAINCHYIKDNVIKCLLSISDHVGERATVKNYHLQHKLIFLPQQVKHQGIPRHWWQKLIRAKAVALAIAITTLPVLTIRTSAYEFANQSITEPIAQAKLAPTTVPPDTASVPQRQLPLILVIEAVVAAMLLVGLIAAYLANRAMRPTLTAAATAKKSVEEEFDSSALLAIQPSFALNQANLPEQQEAEAEQAQLLTEIALRIRQSLYFDDVLKTAVKEVRRAIKTDRVLIYGFDDHTNWDGIVVAESVAPGWAQTLRVKIDVPGFGENYVELYKKGRIRAINNIYQEPGLTDGHIKMLEQFAVKSNLIAPIMKNKQLLGLLIAHHCSEPRTWQKSDIDLFAQVATQIGTAIDQASLLEQQEAETERTQLITEITLRIHQSLYLEDLLKIAVKEVRRALKTDRVLIYGLDPTNWHGLVVAESVAPGWAQTLRVKIDDPCFRERHVEMYQKGHVRAINNIYQEPGLKDCHIKMLEQFAVKANLVAPILKNNQLLGVMIAHHCSEPRTWQKPDIDLFVQLATQVGFAVDQASLREQMEQDREIGG